MSVTVAFNSHYCTCPGQLGQYDTDRIISICVMLHKVVQASTIVTVMCHCCWHIHPQIITIGTWLQRHNLCSLPKIILRKKITSIVYTPRGVCYTPECMPPLWATCKVLLSGIPILVNYACSQRGLLHDTKCFLLPMLVAALHTPQIYFFPKPPKLLQADYTSTIFELSQDQRVFMKSTTAQGAKASRCFRRRQHFCHHQKRTCK